jgi:CRISPR/Cas system endoribonuclease Cas6 (RAMP superfamily)
VKLNIQADSLYLRANPSHSVLVATKGSPQGRASFVIGMQAPLVMSGSEQDLRLAWYAGIGEKNRNGFGCLGLLEHGVGR